MEAERRQLTERLVAVMEQLHLRMRVHAPPEEWPGVELTMPQCRTLWLLGHGPQRMRDIAMCLGTGLPSATSMIDRLVSRGLVARDSDPMDRRVVICKLTPAGEQQVERLWRMGRMRAEHMAGLLSVEELKTVVNAFEVLLSALERQCPRGKTPPTASATDATATST